MEGYTVEEQELARRLTDIAKEAVFLVIRKRRDYGTANIAATGLPGVAVRLVDKAHRLHQLSTRDPEVKESRVDTLTDIVGYGLIGLEIEQGGNGWKR